MIAENLRKKRAFGYVRVSTSEQAEHKTSLRQQEVDLQNYCDKQGIELVEVFGKNSVEILVYIVLGSLSLSVVRI